MQSFLAGDRDKFLQNVSGVIHVGANAGQERHLYDWYDLDVVWIEPIPEVYQTLRSNLRKYSKQKAIECLLADQDGKMCEFHVASNNGQSSSMLEFQHHKDIWPEVSYRRTIQMQCRTLPSALKSAGMNPHNYDALVLDTQGSELLVLQGAASLLEYFKYIKAEAADFDSYVDGCQIADITTFLKPHGYREYSRHKFASRETGGCYYDVVYKRQPI